MDILKLRGHCEYFIKCKRVFPKYPFRFLGFFSMKLFGLKLFIISDKMPRNINAMQLPKCLGFVKNPLITFCSNMQVHTSQLTTLLGHDARCKATSQNTIQVQGLGHENKS